MRRDLRAREKEEAVVIAFLEKGMMGRFEVAKLLKGGQVFAFQQEILHRVSPTVRFDHAAFRARDGFQATLGKFCGNRARRVSSSNSVLKPASWPTRRARAAA